MSPKKQSRKAAGYAAANKTRSRGFTGLSADKQRRLEQDMFYLIDDFNISTNSTVVIPSEYVEVVVVKK